MEIGYLGPKGTFTYEACNNYFSDECVKVEYETIRSVIEALIENKVQYVCVPIENSLNGVVIETIDTLIQNEDVEVFAEYELNINQNLMSKSEKQDITKIYSHPQAISQCREYINKNFKDIELVEMASTALAAKRAAETEDVACIGSLACVDKYDLNLIAANIQDNEDNKTRFWILRKKQGELEMDIIVDKKMSMIISVEHKPGALYELLGIFYRNNINLTKIESRPAKTVLGEYIFIIDCYVENMDITPVFNEIENESQYYRILGIY